MYGAIIGDMVGAPFEFDRGNKTKDFVLFSDKSHFTDDTVMLIAVAEALMDTRYMNDEVIKMTLVDSMRKWGAKYPNAGYGGSFSSWMWRSSVPFRKREPAQPVPYFLMALMAASQIRLS